MKEPNVNKFTKFGNSYQTKNSEFRVFEISAVVWNFVFVQFGSYMIPFVKKP